MRSLLALIFQLPLFAFATGPLCQEWAKPEQIGALETQFINEASGLAVSRQFPDRLYHHNDSGDGPFFYVTDGRGTHTKKISVTGFQPLDVEDISLGPCEFGQCLFLADIGDNLKLRTQLDVWFFQELENFETSVASPQHISLTYPDGPHDAEALAVHPLTGDLYLLSKEADYKVERRAQPAKLYKVPREALSSPTAQLQWVGDIDLPWINFDFGLYGQIATAMDFSPTGDRLLILTYDNAVEIQFSRLQAPVQTRSWIEGTDYQVIRWPPLTSQQEAIAYSSDGKSFYFDSEFNPDQGDQKAPLFRVTCKIADNSLPPAQ